MQCPDQILIMKKNIATFENRSTTAKIRKHEKIKQPHRRAVHHGYSFMHTDQKSGTDFVRI